MPTEFYQLDSFTSELYGGNPAGVCLLSEELSEETMQNIAAENNLSETAFVEKHDDEYTIRWFTPQVEVDLCGHATLAAAKVLFDIKNIQAEEINFQSKSGLLKVWKEGDVFCMAFPVDNLKRVERIHDSLQKGIDKNIVEVFKGRDDYLCVLEDEAAVKNTVPDLNEIAKMDSRGVIITARGEEADFVSRFFAPQSGIDEDPVTGSAHTTLTAYWSNRIDKKEYSALQLSERGGKVGCKLEGRSVILWGEARIYLMGMIYTE